MIHLIIGLPGSGKTHFGEKLAEQDNTIFIDDVELLRNALPLLAYQDVVLAHPRLCDIEALDFTVQFFEEHTEVKLHYFENDLEQCLINSSKREKKVFESYIKGLSKNYNAPNGAMKVYKGD